MKSKLHLISIWLTFMAGIYQDGAQTSKFFRIVGPTATTISAFNVDGTIFWSGANSGATYQVQATTSLAAGSNWVDFVQIPVTNYSNTNLIISFDPPPGMALIPAGTFTIGDTLDGEKDAISTNVYVSAFYMDMNLVSYAQWQSTYSYATNQGYEFDDAGGGKDSNHPVYEVSWYDALKWSNARSQQAGLTPVYYSDPALTEVFSNSDVSPYVNWAANGYRLPTEAEWEKAARGGLRGYRFPWGDTISWQQANYVGDHGGNGFPYDYSATNGYDPTFDTGLSPYTSPVGFFAPNGYGLNDMAGNVFEWCWDWYAAAKNYPPGSPYLGGYDPRGPASSPTGTRVVRGGSWFDVAYSARCACRYDLDPLTIDSIYGFRCVRGL
jgi:formylglycine-generating enzyme required for sulfatase activity